MEAVVDRLAGENVVGHAHGTRRRVLLARGESGPHRRQEVVRLHALEVDRPAPAAVHPRQHEGAGEVPAPARPEHRVGEHGLGQHGGRRCAREHRLDPGEGEAVLRPEREHDGVVVGRRLELEVERDAEALAQRQADAPG